jgi:hypothetical protein
MGTAGNHASRPPGGIPRERRLGRTSAWPWSYFSALAQRGREATEALERLDAPLASSLDEWFDIKPKRMSDLRRLLAAVLLIAPRPRP